MSRNEKASFWLELAWVAARSYLLWTARILITAWYIYFVIHLDLRGGGYLAIAMMMLSIFGLIQLIELIAKLAGLKERTPRTEPQK